MTFGNGNEVTDLSRLFVSRQFEPHSSTRSEYRRSHSLASPGTSDVLGLDSLGDQSVGYCDIPDGPELAVSTTYVAAKWMLGDYKVGTAFCSLLAEKPALIRALHSSLRESTCATLVVALAASVGTAGRSRPRSCLCRSALKVKLGCDVTQMHAKLGLKVYIGCNGVEVICRYFPEHVQPTRELTPRGENVSSPLSGNGPHCFATPASRWEAKSCSSRHHPSLPTFSLLCVTHVDA
uniref:Uncharacterized protein n=1 Tax=Timema douglasi TaxID=61478 RepID=A0A7R8Z7E3_TIMDO|nr:unnamed protein product [Timema douglasi]